MQAADRIRLERNVFRHMGASAVNMVVGVHDSQFIGNVISDVSGSGLSVDLHFEGNPSDTRKTCRRITARNNYITRVGREYYQSVAIMAGYTDGAIIEHNEVHDTSYSGITVGWGWDNVDNAARNNLVRFNDVYHTCTLMADGAGIYTLSKQPGTVIAENYVHDVTRSPWAGGFAIAAIYLDEGSNLITVRDNVLLRNEQNIFQNGNGPSNTFTNNNGSSPTVIANAGLEAAYRNIKPPAAAAGDLVLAFAFNDGSGTTAVDSSGSGNTAQLENGPTWVAGKFGMGVRLDGTNDFVQVSGANLPTGDFTWSAWLFLSQIRDFQTIMEAQGTSRAELEWNVTMSGALSIWLKGAQLFTTSQRLTPGQWHYVTLQRTGTTVRIFVDGVVDANTGSTAGVLNFSNCPLLIGVDADADCSGSLNGYLSGVIDEVRIYRRALSVAEVQQDMTTPVGNAAPPPDTTPLPAPRNLRVVAP
jgi:hypothetical protein